MKGGESLRQYDLPPTLIQPRLEPGRLIRRLARMEQRAIGEAGRVAQSIACCGEERSLRRRCEIAEPLARSLCVVVDGPAREFRAGMTKTQEQRLVRELVTHAAVEALAEGGLHQLAGRDIMPGDAFGLAPGEDGVRGELGTIVGDDRPWARRGTSY